jgi:prevent-host-death family protein
MHVVDFAQAEARFAELLERVQAGEEILVTRANVPVARITPAAPRCNRPRFGAGKDLLRVGADFDEPLADFAPYTG